MALLLIPISVIGIVAVYFFFWRAIVAGFVGSIAKYVVYAALRVKHDVLRLFEMGFGTRKSGPVKDFDTDKAWEKSDEAGALIGSIYFFVSILLMIVKSVSKSNTQV